MDGIILACSDHFKADKRRLQTPFIHTAVFILFPKISAWNVFSKHIYFHGLKTNIFHKWIYIFQLLWIITVTQWFLLWDVNIYSYCIETSQFVEIHPQVRKTISIPSGQFHGCWRSGSVSAGPHDFYRICIELHRWIICHHFTNRHYSIRHWD